LSHWVQNIVSERSLFKEFTVAHKRNSSSFETVWEILG